MFSENDLRQINSHGLNPDAVAQQIANFKHGFPFLKISRAATIGDGIRRYSESEARHFAELYEKLRKGRSVVKFVPASGAATRMFKELFEYVNEGKPSKNAQEVVENIDRFACGKAVRERCPDSDDPRTLLSCIIKEGLDYGKSPKALILFHQYEDGNRTALEEHLAEGALYAASDGAVNIHFTVSPEHQAGFEALVDEVLPKYAEKYGVKYNISYSQQDPATDTIAVTPDNEPFREADGSLLFRPAGHGALLRNLNAIDADIIFIKNIDNVAPDSLKADTVLYKKVIGGVMLSLQKRCFAHLDALERGGYDPELVDEIAAFVQDELCYKLPPSFARLDMEERVEKLRSVLDRPIRVCGMVKNESEPGGGPFWAIEADGSETLQIAEPSQIAPEQKKLIATSTHFNPVDLVCGIKNNKGRKFDITRYVDPDTGLISEKSKDGRTLKAQELPGLWNGSMSRWTTVFVEVPVSTFSPVKTINDLLRPQHQSV